MDFDGMDVLDFTSDLTEEIDPDQWYWSEEYYPPLDARRRNKFELVVDEPLTFAKRVQAEMDRQGINVPRLSELTKINQRTILHYISQASGKKAPANPSVRNAALIANALGVSLDYLSGLTDKPASDAKESEILSVLGLNREAADTLHKLTEFWQDTPGSSYYVLSPWCRPYEIRIESLYSVDTYYGMDFYDERLTYSEILEGILNRKNLSLLRHMLDALWRFILARRNSAMAATDLPKGEEWLAKHPEAEIEFNKIHLRDQLEDLKDTERKAKFDLSCYASELLDNLSEHFPVTPSQRESADRVIELNHTLALRRAKRDREYFELGTMSEQEFIDEELADHTIPLPRRERHETPRPAKKAYTAAHLTWEMLKTLDPGVYMENGFIKNSKGEIVTRISSLESSAYLDNIPMPEDRTAESDDE